MILLLKMLKIPLILQLYIYFINSDENSITIYLNKINK